MAYSLTFRTITAAFPSLRLQVEGSTGQALGRRLLLTACAAQTLDSWAAQRGPSILPPRCRS